MSKTLSVSLADQGIVTNAKIHPNLGTAALVEHAGQRVLALELYTPQTADWLANLQETLAWAKLDELRILDKMPVDKRHNAKINYPALKQLLDGK